MNETEFNRRVLHYARATGIKRHIVPRRGAWIKFGLPDLRGFAPHLRRVNVNCDQKTWNHPWMIHDILHILFYDFATHALGVECWSDPARFLEIHLASEAFAVLALDYSILSRSKKKGLAIELKETLWKQFQNKNPNLPDLQSNTFCEWLFQFYLAGDTKLFRVRNLTTTSLKKAYEEWKGHEYRYATKQRLYAKLWCDDLQNLPLTSRKQAEVTIRNSHTPSVAWDLLSCLLGDSDKVWARYVKEMFRFSKGQENYFSSLPKYQTTRRATHRASRRERDFRFTDVRSLSKKELLQESEKLDSPSSSGLYFLWQVLSQTNPRDYSASEIKIILRLSRAAQKAAPHQKDWNAARTLLTRALSNITVRPDLLASATFFLP